MARNISLGKIGEEIAARYLSAHGYKIIEMNFYKRWGEIDIVAVEDNVLVFVEVKSHMEDNPVTPVESITPWKLKALKRTCLFYKASHPKLPEALRIDFVGIIFDSSLKPIKINHIENISS